MGERENGKAANAPSAQPVAAQSTHDAQPPTAADVDRLTAQGQTVNTAWNVNFRTHGAAAGKYPAPRTQASALYLNDLEIAPEGEAGERAPAPQHFHGVTLAPTGSAFVGSFAHPKDRGGLVSAAVSFGQRPKFDFTVTSPSRSDTTDAKQHHAEIVRDFVAGLDDFVDETEAQTALDRVLAARMEDPGTHGVVKRTDQGKSASVSTNDLKYGPVGASRPFRLRVDVPTVVKDKSVSSSTTTNGEKSIVGETNFGNQTENESTSATSIESQRLSQIERSLRTGIKGVFETFFQHDQSSESVTFKESSGETETSSGTKLNGQVKGTVNLVPDIPIIGWIAKKLIGGSLEINLSPSLDSEFKMSWKKSESETGKGGSGWKWSDRKITESEVEQFAKFLTSTTLKSSVSMAIRVKNSRSDGGKVSGGEKNSQVTSSSTTVGTVHIVSTVDQPYLVEE